MITLEADRLVFRFPQVHEDAACTIHFQRTLRLPDDGRTRPLPAGLGPFPLRHTDDFADRLPADFVRRGGVLMPMWQAEAMWMHFGNGRGAYPCAVKLGTGKISAITGESWRDGLNRDPQDYVVVPRQPWLDGYCVEKGTIRQFVAAPLGSGISVEEQLSGEARHGGIQIVVHPMKRQAYERLFGSRSAMRCDMIADRAAEPMGLAAGGKMRQEVYEDPYDLDEWDQRVGARCFITILNAATWSQLTGEACPTPPVSAEAYAEAGIPWFDFYAADQKAVAGSSKLADVKSVKHAADFGLGDDAWLDHGPIWPRSTKPVGPDRRPVRQPDQVRQGEF